MKLKILVREITVATGELHAEIEFSTIGGAVDAALIEDRHNWVDYSYKVVVQEGFYEYPIDLHNYTYKFIKD